MEQNLTNWPLCHSSRFPKPCPTVPAKTDWWNDIQILQDPIPQSTILRHHSYCYVNQPLSRPEKCQNHKENKSDCQNQLSPPIHISHRSTRLGRCLKTSLPKLRWFVQRKTIIDPPSIVTETTDASTIRITRSAQRHVKLLRHYKKKENASSAAFSKWIGRLCFIPY